VVVVALVLDVTSQAVAVALEQTLVMYTPAPVTTITKILQQLIVYLTYVVSVVMLASFYPVTNLTVDATELNIVVLWQRVG
jgi:hypothetical protein